MATQRILQNNLLIWVDANINHKDTDTQHTLQQLRAVVDHVDLFTQIDQCLPFLSKIKNEQALIITSGSLGQHLVQQIHHLPQVDAIYIFCGQSDRHRSWTSQWSKIRGIHNRIQPICEALRTAVKQTNEDLTPISFVTEGETEDDLNRLDPSFMYTTLFKNILLDMEHEPDAKEAIVKFCRTHYADNPKELEIVDEFGQDYQSARAIWWYTRECFTYQMMNRALRLLESDIIVDMGFLIHDLHQHLKRLHAEQFGDYRGPPLTLHRGQALSEGAFAKLQKSQRGLLAFNSFLATSTEKTVALDFARQASKRDETIGVFFVMTVNPRIHSATFADIEKHSYFPTEKEVLFSMHTVFLSLIHI